MARGKATCQKTLNLEQPSMSAASSSSRGMAAKNPRRIQIENGYEEGLVLGSIALITSLNTLIDQRFHIS